MTALCESAPRAIAVLLGLICSTLATRFADAETLVLRGTLYTEPGTVIRDGVLLISEGKIRAVGAEAAVRVPAGAVESDCNGGFILAGFHNSHVHFTGPQFANAHQRPASELTRANTDMLLRFGFTTATDAASELPNTLALRARIDSGEIGGPRILTAGLPLYPPQGLPFYLRENLPPAVLEQLPQPVTAQAALAVIRRNLNAGADATKLFVATPQRDQPVKRMPLEIAVAAAQETHQRGKLVLAHPTDLGGLRAAVQAGVDIVMHTTFGEASSWPEALVQQMIAKRVAVVPTLQLWPYELGEAAQQPGRKAILDATLAQLAGFAKAGGEVLFGTDVGYMSDFDPTVEYQLMAKAGLGTAQILAALTTAPSARWNESARRGRLANGMDADIVVLEEDPAKDVRNFAQVGCTLRGGKTLFSKPRF